ncbi:LytTR family DNA-binding domain-containing protein [uncultured Roseovarius sp.]|uniref:LytTR family DNA-binding domain-containing protein n=1 Tax=uncultured Roseovarius sp. TaxID=293344 RepID=UPI002632EA44|nr:LytTR family DNA-binding domain-containing protein [uncultured Roseovarius sp.]
MMWPNRLVYWSVVISVGLVLGFSARATMRALLGPRMPLLFDIGAGLLVAVFLGPFIWGLRGWMDPMLAHSHLSMASTTLNTFLIVFGIFVLRRQIGAETPRAYLRPGENPESAPLPRIHRRLSTHSDAEVLRLSASDHFVEVATTAGVENLRLRLADAIEEMEPVKGLCTHRSHWVTMSAISHVAREGGGKMFVVLRNGDRVPVSRKYRPRLAEAGLIEPS